MFLFTTRTQRRFWREQNRGASQVQRTMTFLQLLLLLASSTLAHLTSVTKLNSSPMPLLPLLFIGRSSACSSSLLLSCTFAWPFFYTFKREAINTFEWSLLWPHKHNTLQFNSISAAAFDIHGSSRKGAKSATQNNQKTEKSRQRFINPFLSPAKDVDKIWPWRLTKNVQQKFKHSFGFFIFLLDQFDRYPELK